MQVLLIGNLSALTNSFFTKLDEERKYVTYPFKDNGVRFQGKNIVHYRQENGQNTEELDKICCAFDFDAVLFFSSFLDGCRDIRGEVEQLEQALQAAQTCKVRQFIYLTTNDADGQVSQETGLSRNLLLQDCQELLERYQSTAKLRIQILKLPHLYSLDGGTSRLNTWIANGAEGRNIALNGAQTQETDFLCTEDLAQLLDRMLDDPPAESGATRFVTGGNALTFADLGNLLKNNFSQTEVSFLNENVAVPCSADSKSLREEYGWFPHHLLDDDVITLAEQARQKAKSASTRRKFSSLFHMTRSKVRVVLELAAVFLLSQGLNVLTKDNVLVNFIDFRQLFVVIMGTMNGLNAGIVAAILSCLGYVLFDVSDMQWQVVFYNIENWLPFAVYFLLGAVSGYIRDRHEDDVTYVKEEHQLLEKKYIFLSQLYNKVLESKDSFNGQIIGYKDSFGKIYSAVRRLDAMLPDKVFFESVNTLEALLDNHSVAIYSITGDSSYARLNVCSKSLHNVLKKSMNLDSYPAMMEKLCQGNTFVNTACLPDYPFYATPIQRNGRLVGVILLMSVTDRQMTVEFENKFNIIANLTSDSLFRAMEFEQMSSRFIPETQILTAEKFREILGVKDQMQENHFLDYVLVHLDPGELSIRELNDRVCKCVRDSDVLGMGKDGQVYLLLNQSNTADLPLIQSRIEKTGVRLEMVKG